MRAATLTPALSLKGRGTPRAATELNTAPDSPLALTGRGLG
ncbi:hypothetical protein ACLB1N_23455 [Escherichia coli]